MWRDIFKPQYLNWRWGFCVCLSIYIEVFILYYEPLKGSFLPYQWDTEQDFFAHCFINGLIMFVVCTFTLIVLPKFFPTYFKPEKLGKLKFATLVLLTTFLISLGSIYTTQIYFHLYKSLSWYVFYLFNLTVSVMVFAGIPFFVIYLVIFSYFVQEAKQNNAFSDSPKATNNQAEKLDIVQLEHSDIVLEETKNFTESEPTLLIFTDTSNKKSLRIPINNFYYATSAQNYIEIFYNNKNGERVRTVLRNSLKLIEEEMIETAKLPLIRCHKAYIINCEKIVDFSGSSKISQFQLKDTETLIPISRNKFAEYKMKYQDVFANQL
jgi:DNA-binding LytR/AlgR family response regulator